MTWPIIGVFVWLCNHKRAAFALKYGQYEETGGVERAHSLTGRTGPAILVELKRCKTWRAACSVYHFMHGQCI